MTDNISRMYELAGIENYRLYNYVGFEPKGYKFILNKDNPKKVEKVVRDFSVEKQLELIKWIAKNLTFGVLIHTYDSKFHFNIFKNRLIRHADFSQALAGLVCELWEDLTDEQKEEIKRVLE